MITDEHKNELLEDFRTYLEQSNLEQLAVNQQPDLSDLLSEMAGLKAEVKAESRQFKNTLDTLNSALNAVQDDNKILSAELAAHSERLTQQRSDILRTVLLDIVDIFDRLSTGLAVLQNYRPVSSLFNHSKDKDVLFIKRFTEGQVMTVKRFEQFLQRYHIRTIDCIGKLLDPARMSAVETGQDPNFENGIVLEELRKGFLFQDQVLRLAEVKVNKINTR